LSYNYLKYYNINDLISEIERLAITNQSFTEILNILYDYKRFEELAIFNIHSIIDMINTQEKNNYNNIIIIEDDES